jgi:indolepyruvate decarboxylase
MHVSKNAPRPAIAPDTLGPVVGDGDDPITADTLYPGWAASFGPMTLS